MVDNKKLRVMVVDDTVVYRKILSDVLSGLSDVTVVGTAHNGRVALSRIASLKPDLLTLDIEMPEMNGLELLVNMRKMFPEVGAIMVSTLTLKGGDMTMEALELGAFDFITKPQSGTMEENKKEIQSSLIPMVKAFSRRREIRGILKGKITSGPDKNILAGSGTAMKSVEKRAGARKAKSSIVGIGISTGGPNALARMMPKLPGNLGVPILIVQHMPAVFTQSLAKSLNSRCAMEIREAVDGEPLRPNCALIAPGGKQMKVVAGADGKNRVIRITDDPPENSCKPSVDYLFRSVGQHYVGRATGVIMTGMGRDGTLGLKLMKRNGAITIAQDERSCVVFGMPRESIKAGVVDVIAPLDKIAEEICRTIQ